MSIRILIAADHTMFADMLQVTLVNQRERHEVVGIAGDGETALALTLSQRPDLLLLDYKTPQLGRLASFCQKLLRQSPATKILVIGNQTEEEVAIEAAVGGVHGYISKVAPVAHLCTAVVSVHAGGIWVDPHLSPRVFHSFLHAKSDTAQHLKELSRQELTVLTFLAQGMSNQQISIWLHISPKTVKNHLTHIFAKLRTRNRHQAARQFFSADRVGYQTVLQGLSIPEQEGKKQRIVYLTGDEERNEGLAPRIPWRKRNDFSPDSIEV